jgi:hypothetical protein
MKVLERIRGDVRRFRLRRRERAAHPDRNPRY